MTSAKIDALSPEEIQKRLTEIPEWNLKNKKLSRDLKFKDFKEAFAFLTKAAEIAEEMNHHPEWTNVYNRLTIDLTTHDAGGISSKDFLLAKRLNAIL